MKANGRMMVLGTALMFWAIGAGAGSLDPTNGPSPTMHTLEEIYQNQIATLDKVDTILAPVTLADTTTVVKAGYYEATTLDGVDSDLAAGNIRESVVLFGITGTAVVAAYDAPVARTGARDLPSYTEEAGEDGHASMRKGVAWPSPRFTDNSNGTVTDNLTGLIWLKNAVALGAQVWTNALTGCATLNTGEHGLTDGSAEGDWRLPHIQELRSLVDHGYMYPAVPVGHPFTGVLADSAYYWSGTTYANGTASAWYVLFDDGRVSSQSKTASYYVWPVRGGP